MRQEIRATSIGQGVAPDLLTLLTELQNSESRSALPKLNDAQRAAKDFGASELQEYSAYIIGPKGHVTRRIDLLCADDADAHQCARELVDGHTVELWQHARWIATFVPRREQLFGF